MSQPPPLPTSPPPLRRPPRSAASPMAAICTLGCVAVSADVLWRGRLYQYDTTLARAIYRFMMDSPRAIGWCSAFSRLGDWPFSVAVGVVVGLVLAALGRIRLVMVWTIGLLGSAALNFIMKSHFAEPRPTLFSQFPLDDGFTYPSGHVMAAVMTFGLIAYLLTFEAPRFRWFWSFAALVLILAVAGSLLLLGVHYLTDILGGLTLGGGWLFLVIAMLGPERPVPKLPQHGFPVVT